uniref:Uncharacterized protein n=1 Tax=Meloidogyne incognita TaxID=6306 RepID=A0A914KUX6_MELIC
MYALFELFSTHCLTLIYQMPGSLSGLNSYLFIANTLVYTLFKLLSTKRRNYYLPIV